MAPNAKPVGPDFCLVQLSPAGKIAAGQHPLRYSNGSVSYVFQPDEPVKVARYEWDLALASHCTASGDVLFEVVQPEATNSAIEVK